MLNRPIRPVTLAPRLYLRSYVLLLFTAATLCCTKRLPDADAATLEQWFTGTNMPIPPSLLATSDTTLDALLALFGHDGIAQKEIITLTDTTGTPFSVGFQTPPTIAPDTTYPCIIYLHGGTGTTVNTKGEHAWKMLSMLTRERHLFLVSPSANRMAPWWSAPGLSRILQTLRYMSLHYPINPDRVYLVGVSDGATGCWAAANTIPGPFAGFIAISGFGGILPQLGIELYPQNLMQRPIYTIHAGNDRLYPLSVVTPFLDYMASVGVGVERKIYPEEEHGFDYREKECTKITALLDQWQRTPTTNIVWQCSFSLPVNADHLVSAELQSGATQGSLISQCNDGVLHITASGFSGINVALTTTTPCLQQGVVVVNSQKPITVKAHPATRAEELREMKHRCFPRRPTELFLTIPLGN